MEVQPFSQLPLKYDYDNKVTLNQGGFSAVYKIAKNDTKQVFAMKALRLGHGTSKDAILQTNHIKREKLALESFDHPFIIKLYEAFASRGVVYYILDFMDLGDFMKVMNKYHRLTLECTRFYTAELVLALDYLRTQQFVHRDIKIENVLLSNKFHIKLADFGVAKKITDPGRQGPYIYDFKQRSMPGTPEYYAPEIVRGGPLTYSTDLWGLAGFISDLRFGYWICRKNSDERWTDEHFQRVEDGDYQVFGVRNPDPEVMDIIRGLTRTDPTRRLGAASMSAVMSHPLYRPIQWDRLIQALPPKLESADSFVDPSDPRQRQSYQEEPTKSRPSATPTLSSPLDRYNTPVPRSPRRTPSNRSAVPSLDFDNSPPPVADWTVQTPSRSPLPSLDFTKSPSPVADWTITSDLADDEYGGAGAPQPTPTRPGGYTRPQPARFNFDSQGWRDLFSPPPQDDNDGDGDEEEDDY